MPLPASALPLLLRLLVPAAQAQAVTAVPPGARAVTVMVCDQPDGCAEPFRVLSDHCAAQGIPLLDFDAVIEAGPAGGDARAALDEALAAAAQRPDLARLEAARQALRGTPLTLPREEVFSLWIRLGAARLAEGDAAGADLAFAAAVSSSGARVWDLPELSPEALDRYLALAGARGPSAHLKVNADHPDATVFIDGQALGAAPQELSLAAGWHRISVERPGRRSAWVGEVQAPAGGRVELQAEIAADDGVAALESAVLGEILGTEAPVEVARRLSSWARTQGLGAVRFVAMRPAGTGAGVPEERLSSGDQAWDLRAAWLDVSARRLHGRGPGPATLRAAADPDRFSLGLQLGYRRLQQQLPSGPDPHDHVDVELVGLALLRPGLALDARVSLWRAAQPYYLYEDWLAHDLVAVSPGLRWMPGRSGWYLGGHGLVLIPVALGGEAFSGWTWRPTPRWRLGVEGRGGLTDQGAVFGGGLSAAFSG